MRKYTAVAGAVLPNSRPVWNQVFTEIGAMDERVTALVADLSRPTFTDQFKNTYPDRFYNVGIAEQNMLGIAAGLALKGKIPYCVTYAPFGSMRASEQFRTDACYMNLPVRLITVGSGLSPAGATHSGMEDAGIMRTMAGATVIAPGDPYSFGQLLKDSVAWDGPVYFRLGFGAGERQIYGEDADLKIGEAIELKEGKDVTVISFGVTLPDTLAAADALAEEGISVQVIDMHTIKPLDKEAVLSAMETTGKIITVEDHNVIGGLGSAVAEVIAESGKGCAFKRLGIPDTYAHFGTLPYLHSTYGYDKEAVIKAVKEML